ncbi:hypothetical protein GCM10023206_00930 [Acinetobacter puyangensis]
MSVNMQRGFSLIELMITIAIMGILVVAGTALTAQWSKQAELDKAIWSLQSAISLARATAIRNQYAKDAESVTGQVCFNNTDKVLTIREATDTGVASCTSTIIYSYPLSQNIEIKKADNITSFTCFAFDSRAKSIAGTESCPTSLTLNISNGTLNESKTFD